VSSHSRTWRRGAGLAAAAVLAATLAPLSSAQAVPAEPVPTVYTDPIGTPVEIHSVAATETPAFEVTGLPEGLSLTADATTTPGTVTWLLSGTPTGAPTPTPADVTLTITGEPDPITFQVNVAPEDATPAYTGPATILAEAGTAKVKLAASVTSQPDGTPGDLSKATLTFADTVSGNVLCDAVPVTAAGTATCEVDAKKATYALKLTVGGSYTGTSAADAPVAVQVAPETTITSGPAEGSVLMTTKATFTFAASDPAATFVCTLTGKTKPCTGGTVTFGNMGKRPHTFTVAAVGADGATDPTPATRSFVVPLDDVSLSPSKQWKRASSAKAYQGTFLKTTTKNSTLTRSVNGAKGLSVIVRTEKNAGSLKVLLNGTKVGTIKLAQSGKWRVIALPGLPETVTGKITLKTGGKKAVKVDGLAILK
jgi:hypothetical protein